MSYFSRALGEGQLKKIIDSIIWKNSISLNFKQLFFQSYWQKNKRILKSYTLCEITYQPHKILIDVKIHCFLKAQLAFEQR